MRTRLTQGAHMLCLCVPTNTPQHSEGAHTMAAPAALHWLRGAFACDGTAAAWEELTHGTVPPRLRSTGSTVRTRRMRRGASWEVAASQLADAAVAQSGMPQRATVSTPLLKTSTTWMGGRTSEVLDTLRRAMVVGAVDTATAATVDLVMSLLSVPCAASKSLLTQLCNAVRIAVVETAPLVDRLFTRVHNLLAEAQAAFHSSLRRLPVASQLQRCTCHTPSDTSSTFATDALRRMASQAKSATRRRRRAAAAQKKKKKTQQQETQRRDCSSTATTACARLPWEACVAVLERMLEAVATVAQAPRSTLVLDACALYRVPVTLQDVMQAEPQEGVWEALVERVKEATAARCISSAPDTAPPGDTFALATQALRCGVRAAVIDVLQRPTTVERRRLLRWSATHAVPRTSVVCKQVTLRILRRAHQQRAETKTREVEEEEEEASQPQPKRKRKRARKRQTAEAEAVEAAEVEAEADNVVAPHVASIVCSWLATTSAAHFGSFAMAALLCSTHTAAATFRVSFRKAARQAAVAAASRTSSKRERVCASCAARRAMLAVAVLHSARLVTMPHLQIAALPPSIVDGRAAHSINACAVVEARRVVVDTDPHAVLRRRCATVVRLMLEANALHVGSVAALPDVATIREQCEGLMHDTTAVLLRGDFHFAPLAACRPLPQPLPQPQPQPQPHRRRGRRHASDAAAALQPLAPPPLPLAAASSPSPPRPPQVPSLVSPRFARARATTTTTSGYPVAAAWWEAEAAAAVRLPRPQVPKKKRQRQRQRQQAASAPVSVAAVAAAVPTASTLMYLRPPDPALVSRAWWQPADGHIVDVDEMHEQPHMAAAWTAIEAGIGDARPHSLVRIRGEQRQGGDTADVLLPFLGVRVAGHFIVPRDGPSRRLAALRTHARLVGVAVACVPRSQRSPAGHFPAWAAELDQRVVHMRTRQVAFVVVAVRDPHLLPTTVTWDHSGWRAASEQLLPPPSWRAATWGAVLRHAVLRFLVTGASLACRSVTVWGDRSSGVATTVTGPLLWAEEEEEGGADDRAGGVTTVSQLLVPPPPSSGSGASPAASAVEDCTLWVRGTLLPHLEALPAGDWCDVVVSRARRLCSSE